MKGELLAMAGVGALAALGRRGARNSGTRAMRRKISEALREKFKIHHRWTQGLRGVSILEVKPRKRMTRKEQLEAHEVALLGLGFILDQRIEDETLIFRHSVAQETVVVDLIKTVPRLNERATTCVTTTFYDRPQRTIAGPRSPWDRLLKPKGSPNTHPFTFWSDCIGLTAHIVDYITDDDRSQEITYTTFARHANVKALRDEDHPATYRMGCPDNWSISFHKSSLPSGRPCYYFAWSGIEHVFVDKDDGYLDRDEEDRFAREAEDAR